jgi:hypothetical protein
MRIKKNVLYWIGRPEVTKGGRFNRQSTTYQTAFLDENGKVIYGQQTYFSYGAKGVPENVIKVTRAEFQKMLNAK